MLTVIGNLRSTPNSDRYLRCAIHWNSEKHCGCNNRTNLNKTLPQVGRCIDILICHCRTKITFYIVTSIPGLPFSYVPHSATVKKLLQCSTTQRSASYSASAR